MSNYATLQTTDVGLLRRQESVGRRSARAEPDELSISEVAQLFGISYRTLRFYEAKGLISPRRAGTQRYYRSAERARLTAIIRARSLGFTVAEIRELINNGRADGALDVEYQLSPYEINQKLTDLKEQRDDLIKAIALLQSALEATVMRR